MPHAPTPASAHTGHQAKRAHTRGAQNRTLVLTFCRIQHPTPAQGSSPGPSAVPHGPLPPPTPQPPPPKQPHPPPPPRPHPALLPQNRGGNLPDGPPNPSPPRATPLPPRPTPNDARPAARPQPKTAAKQPPEPVGAPRPQPAAKPKPKPKPGATTAARAQPPEDVLYDIQPQPSQAGRQQRPARRPPTVTDATATTFMAERAAAEARRTSSRDLSKHALKAHGPARPDQNDTRVHQQRPRPPTNPRCQPIYSTCPATAAAASRNPTPWRRPFAHTCESTSARAPTPRAPPRHRTTRNPPGPPPPPVPTTQSHPPTPETAAPPRDSGGGAGCTQSSGSCAGGPRQIPPLRAWYTGPARGWCRTAASSRRGGGCRRPHWKPCWPMRSSPWEFTPATSPRPRTTCMSSGSCGRPSRRHSETASPCGTSPKAQPRTHTHPRHPTGSAHRHRRHRQHRTSPARHTARRT